MPKYILPAYSGEGPTDERFLGQIIQRTLDELLLDADQQIFSQSTLWIGKVSGREEIVTAARKANEYTVQLYCVHADSDGPSYEKAFKERLKPAFSHYEAERKEGDEMILIPVIPVQMTEAWMLADTDLLKRLIRTGRDDNELGWTGAPEKKANPKEVIKRGLRIANQDKGTHLKAEIGPLYGDMAEHIDLEKLQKLSSYNKFRASLQAALVKLGYLQS